MGGTGLDLKKVNGSLVFQLPSIPSIGEPPLHLTAYPFSIGGAQLLAHNLAKQLIVRHRLRVITQWSERRTDWLLGTTLNAPSADITVDGPRRSNHTFT